MSYNDLEEFLLPTNLNGNSDGQSITSSVPGQPLQNISGDYIITYSVLDSLSDMINTGYYSATDEEHLKFIDPADYQQSIENDLVGILSASTAADPTYVWFQEVANITFSETAIGTNDLDGSGSIDQPNEYTTGHIAIGQLDNWTIVTQSFLPTLQLLVFNMCRMHRLLLNSSMETYFSIQTITFGIQLQHSSHSSTKFS